MTKRPLLSRRSDAPWPGERNACEPKAGEEPPRRLATSYPYRVLTVCIIAITLQPELAPGSGPLSQQTVIDRTVRLFAYLWHAPGPFVIAVALETQNPPY